VIVPDGSDVGYQPIEDYGVIGNLRTIALVGLDGSIDWCCLPEFDSPSVFAAILDGQKGGRFRVAPLGPYRSKQHYIEETNILRTIFETAAGRLILTDFMPLRGSITGSGTPPTTPQIHRILHCDEGEVDVVVDWSPRFDYARAQAQITPLDGGFRANSALGSLTLVIARPMEKTVVASEEGPSLQARVYLRRGESTALATRFGSGDPRCDLSECQAALEDTVASWRAWAHHCDRQDACAFAGQWHSQVVRSGLTLKLLTHPDTGAIAAAPTTSLPEELGGVRNWDYRYTWIRDAAFTAQALFALGHRTEAVDFLTWAERVCMAKESRSFTLQIMYGLRGETELPEHVLEHLQGYHGSRPVRIGNAAAVQHQLDIYGELLGSAFELVRMGGSLDPNLMTFLSRVADQACALWREPDFGIWEVRGGPRHFVHSKVMACLALDRAILLAERHGMPGDRKLWRRERDSIYRAVLSEGFDSELGSFVQSFGSKSLDAANLLIPIVGFLPFDDPRVQGTIDRTLERLTDNGIVYRYLAGDGLPGGEGAFLLTTFWLVDALALSGKTEKAGELFEGTARRANHLGLYAEQIDPRSGAFLGNFPQAFSHIGFINSALYLARSEGRRAPGPAPVGSREHGEETERETRAKA
jgi:GH15 family glucan-1,4-alpha-glucosidase